MFKLAKENAKTDDIIYHLGGAVPAAMAQVKNANLPEVIGLSGGNIASDGILAGQWIRNNVTYRIDDFQNQNIQLPSALLRSGFGDCKSLSLLFMAIMNAAGYNAGFRFARYKNKGSFTHVYNVILDNQNKLYTFDVCVKDLKELKHYKEIKDMNINYIAGAPLMIQKRSRLKNRQIVKPTFEQLMRDDRYLTIANKIGEPEFLGRKKGKFFKRPIFKKIGDTVKKGIKLVKTVGLAVARGPFLVLVDVNFRGLAKRLDKLRTKNPKDYQEFWVKLGGDVDALNKAVNKGKDKKPFLGAKKGVNGATAAVYIGGDDSIMSAPNDSEYIGFDPASIGAALTSAAGILAAIQKLFKKNNVGGEPGEGDLFEDTDPNTPISPDVEPGSDFFANDPATPAAANYAESGGKNVPPVLDSTRGLSATNTNLGFKPSPILLIGGAAAVLGIIMLTKKKK
jgi:hypothetical protein